MSRWPLEYATPAQLGPVPEGASALLGAGIGLAFWIGIGAVVHRRVGGDRRVTLATWVTIARGAIAAALSGFVVVGVPAGNAGWLVPAAFAAAGLLDAVDGYVARVTDTVSPLGERLDTEADGLLVLVGAALVVAEGLVAPWFLAVGLARYAYVAGRLLRRRRGLPAGTDDSRRLNAAVYTGTLVGVWVALFPPTDTPFTAVVLTVVGVAQLLGFGRSWLVVTGRL